MPDTFNPQEWITTTEAAKLTGYKPVTVRLLARKRRIKGEKRGRDWFLDKKDVLAYAQEMQLLGTAKHDKTRKKE